MCPSACCGLCCLLGIPNVGPKFANPRSAVRGPPSACEFRSHATGFRVWGCDPHFEFGFRMLVVISDVEFEFTARVRIRLRGSDVPGSEPWVPNSEPDFGTQLRDLNSETESGTKTREPEPGTRRRRHGRRRRTTTITTTPTTRTTTRTSTPGLPSLSSRWWGEGTLPPRLAGGYGW